MSFKYQSKTEKQLRNWYNAKHRNGVSGFRDFKDFFAWYNEQEKKCVYCNLTEVESQKIVVSGLLTSNRFPQNGVHGRGTSRGMWLEVDRYAPRGLYSQSNSVLCCYFCNNDKSDVFHGDEYRKFLKDRIGYLKGFLNQ